MKKKIEDTAEDFFSLSKCCVLYHQTEKEEGRRRRRDRD